MERPRLTLLQRREVRRLRSKGLRLWEVAAIGCSRQTVTRVLSGPGKLESNQFRVVTGSPAPLARRSGGDQPWATWRRDLARSSSSSRARRRLGRRRGFSRSAAGLQRQVRHARLGRKERAGRRCNSRGLIDHRCRVDSDEPAPRHRSRPTHSHPRRSNRSDDRRTGRQPSASLRITCSGECRRCFICAVLLAPSWGIGLTQRVGYFNGTRSDGPYVGTPWLLAGTDTVIPPHGARVVKLLAPNTSVMPSLNAAFKVAAFTSEPDAKRIRSDFAWLQSDSTWPVRLSDRLPSRLFVPNTVAVCCRQD